MLAELRQDLLYSARPPGPGGPGDVRAGRSPTALSSLHQTLQEAAKEYQLEFE